MTPQDTAAMRPRRPTACTCRHCLAHTVKRALWQYHSGRPEVAGLMLFRVVECLEADCAPVCLRGRQHAVTASEQA